MPELYRIPAEQFRVPSVIAISKTHPAEAILPLLQAGHRDFGENRVQEAQQKWPALKAQFPDIRLHLVGSLQSNKAAEACALFDVIHSVDRVSLVEALAKCPSPLPQLLVQVNTGEEAQKGGVAPLEVPALLAAAKAKHLNITGLMCVPPVVTNPNQDETALHFALLATLAREHHLPTLSMGMSADYLPAAALGATYVRIGTAIFGER